MFLKVVLNDWAFELLAELVELLEFNVFEVVFFEELELFAEMTGFFEHFDRSHVAEKAGDLFVPIVGLERFQELLRWVGIIMVGVEAVLRCGHMLNPILI